MSLKFSSIPPKRLAQGITSASSSFYVNNILSFDGLTDVVPADLGTQHFVCFRNDTGTRVEFMEIDPATISTGPITISRRGLSYYGDLTTEDADLKYDWSANETLVMFGTDVPQIFQWLKEYIDAASIAGAVPASTSAAGIVVEASQAEADAGTATKTISATAYDLFVRPDKVRARKYHDYAADSGSTDAYAITLTPAPAAYATGQVFIFKANTVNTGTATLNVNSLGAKTIVKSYNVTLEDGDIKANQIVEVIYDGTNFQLLSPISLPITPIIRRYVLADSPATWTKPSGLKYVVVEVVGGGSGGSGSSISTSSGGGGGGGGYSRKVIAVGSLGATETVTIGAGGAGGNSSGSAGSAGGTSSFGSHCTATGGQASGGGGGAGGSGGSGSDGDLNTTGGGGGAGMSVTGATGGVGGSSYFGGGAAAVPNGNEGNAGTAYGGGGGGSAGSVVVGGGAGHAGVVIVTEYYS